MKYLGVLGVLLCFVVLEGCLGIRPPGVSRIRGGMSEKFPEGELSTLTLERPDGELIVAVRYPRPIDESWYPGYGHSGNGDDVTHWEETYKIRFGTSEDAEVLVVKWEYSSVTKKITFGDKLFDLPKGKLAVLSYDKDLKPLCELREATPQVVQQLRTELGERERPHALPAMPES